MTQEDRELILKIARHFSEKYQQRTEAILHLADVIEQKQTNISISINRLGDKDWECII